MYYECKIIDGRWMERYGPQEEWTEVKAAALMRVEEHQARIRELEAKLGEAKAAQGKLEAQLAAAEAKEEEAAALMQEFVDRCERGEVRSRYTYGRFTTYLRSRPAHGAQGEEKGECPVCKGDGNSREQLGPPCDHCNGTGCAGCDEDEELMREVDEFHRAKEASDG